MGSLICDIKIISIFSGDSILQGPINYDSDAPSEGGISIPHCNIHKKTLGPRTLSTVSAPCSAGSSQADSINTVTIAVPKLETVKCQNDKQNPPITIRTRSLKNNKYLAVPFK